MPAAIETAALQADVTRLLAIAQASLFAVAHAEALVSELTGLDAPPGWSRHALAAADDDPAVAAAALLRNLNLQPELILPRSPRMTQPTEPSGIWFGDGPRTEPPPAPAAPPPPLTSPARLRDPQPPTRPSTIRLHLGRDSYQGDTSHELCFGEPRYKPLSAASPDVLQFDHPTGRSGCTLPLPDWFVYRLFGRLLQVGEVQPVDITLHTEATP